MVPIVLLHLLSLLLCVQYGPKNEGRVARAHPWRLYRKILRVSTQFMLPNDQSPF